MTQQELKTLSFPSGKDMEPQVYGETQSKDAEDKYINDCDSLIKYYKNR